jgi:hypothetical protein
LSKARQLHGQPESAARACERLLGTTALRVESPGGRMRRSIRVFLKDRSVIVTQRRHPARAQLEAEVLRALGAQGAPVPQLLSFDGAWLIQEDLGPNRLSQTLAAMREAEGEALLVKALAGLAAAQRAGQASGLDRQVVTIGTGADWLLKLASTHERIGGQLKLPTPVLQTDRLPERLSPQRPTFIKWDARPANAVVRSDASVAWFDWEHCGCRDPLDDLVWLLCDEYTPDWPEAEARLIARFLPSFSNGSAPGVAHDYLMTFGTLHSCIRLSLILTEKAGGPWWNTQRCLDHDSVGVTLEMALRVCRRAARCAARGELTQGLSPWLLSIAEHLQAGEPRVGSS